MRNQRQVDENGELKHQTFPSSTISGPNGNDQNTEERKVTKSRMDDILNPQAVSLRSQTVPLWDSSNALGDICITLAALLVWKVPVASIQYIDPSLAMCIALLSMYFTYRLMLVASTILL
ncbi:hypothetical protein NOF04DRAFT_17971 [Fusarium oxysporum II5]|uniref:Uncharacterized protein n=2 Tax=Fusarium oxysporum species complex TaxID=171631 RepID=X0IR79_FUSO5|nr:uncharacterized protein FOIG_15486 [Fusarium odoratissimum NRRL 54006]EXL91332.1 hypothetical protein FOIG_15486 [Fusarium odoratissimum NRRL 54006]KAK2123263.1 hypothetical protein NOF04DRAFT_17971 [Fusarium oxysporum II5]TXB97054.1 hypothetical protein FocTR4_00011838 [Fusarium oxysporum f. sp. cubense]